jgi:hypothetical protein
MSAYSDMSFINAELFQHLYAFFQHEPSQANLPRSYNHSYHLPNIQNLSSSSTPPSLTFFIIFFLEKKRKGQLPPWAPVNATATGSTAVCP